MAKGRTAKSVAPSLLVTSDQCTNSVDKMTAPLTDAPLNQEALNTSTDVFSPRSRRRGIITETSTPKHSLVTEAGNLRRSARQSARIANTAISAAFEVQLTLWTPN